MALDLFEIAEANAHSIKLRFEQVRDFQPDHDQATLNRFEACVRDQSTIAINLRPWIVANILTTGRYQNIYEWADEQASVSGRSVEEILREKLKDLYVKRVSFDAAFADGIRFRYGALYLAGAGVTRYGKFCLVLSRDFVESGIPVAYVPADSLKTYMCDDSTLDEAGIREHAGPHTHRGFLAAIKLSDSLSARTESDWPLLLCSDADYIEAIFIADLDHNAVECIRVPVAEYEQLWDLAFSDFGKRVGSAGRALAHDFASILRAARERSIPLEEV
jgi:hypothetical protein